RPQRPEDQAVKPPRGRTIPKLAEDFGDVRRTRWEGFVELEEWRELCRYVDVGRHDHDLMNAVPGYIAQMSHEVRLPNGSLHDMLIASRIQIAYERIGRRFVADGV